MGGVQVYTTALACVINDDLKKEWQKYLDQTKNHEQVVRNLFGKVGLDPEGETPGRAVVRHLGKGLVKAMLMAQQAGHPEEAELVSLLLGGPARTGTDNARPRPSLCRGVQWKSFLIATS